MRRERTTGVSRRAARRRRGWRRRRLATAGLAVVAAAIVVVAWPARWGGDSVLVVVRGRSMEPTYHLGDLLYARTVDAVRPGQALVYRVPRGEPGAGSLVVHRLETIGPDGALRFRGDHNSNADASTVTADDVVAEPRLNLGPLPTRVLLTLPLWGSLLVAIAIGFVLWPAEQGVSSGAPGSTAGPCRPARHRAAPAPARRGCSS